MSYWIYLEIDTGGEELVTAVEVGNYTANVSSMWNLALGGELAEKKWKMSKKLKAMYDCAYSIKRFHGENAGKIVSVLKKAVKNMEENPNKYTKLNPENGWGDYEGALKYLKNFLSACEDNPKCIIYISC